MSDTPGSPQWWLKRLDRDLKLRAKKIERWNDYYEGDHELAFATDKFKAAFGGQFKELADNWMALVVDSVEERLNVEGFRFGDDSAADADAWYVWQANNLDAESGLGHLEALATGTAYALIDWTGSAGSRNGKDVPVVTIEDPTQVIHATEPGNRRVRAAALKRWRDDIENEERAVLYLPDTVFQLRRNRGKWDTIEEIPNPLGVVPVVPIENRTRLLGEGVAEHRNVIPLQNAVNKLVADLIVASEYAAFFQRWATGIDVPQDEQGNPVAPFDVGLNKLLVDTNPDAKFGAFPATDLTAYVRAIELGIQHIASQSRTPPHYLLGQAGSFPSGEPIAVTEAVRTANRGWTTMGDVQVGDLVFAPNGSQVAVSAVHDVHTDRRCLGVVFDDGTAVVTDEGHRWPVLALPANKTGDTRVPRTVTSAEMAATLRLPNSGNGRNRNGAGTARFAIPVAAPLDGPDVSLPVDPWVLGYWLGNGGRNGSQLSVHTQDAAWVQARLELAGYESTAKECSDRQATVVTPHGLRKPLRQAGVFDRKHIPADYLAGSLKQRLELLQGVLDADGSPDRFGRGTIDLSDSDLAHDVHELVLSLGQKARIREGRARSRTPDGKRYEYTRWRLAWTPSLPVFSLPRKAERQRITQDGKARLRYVVDVCPVDSVPVRCITVDSPEHTFLVGRSLVPTCNSLKATETGLIAKVRRRMRSFEDSWEDVMRLCFKARGDERAGIVDAETVWRDPESRTESEHIDALVKLRALDVPNPQLWEDAGYSPQQIARFRTMSAEDLLQQAITATAQTEPTSTDVTPTAGEASAVEPAVEPGAQPVPVA